MSKKAIKSTPATSEGPTLNLPSGFSRNDWGATVDSDEQHDFIVDIVQEIIKGTIDVVGKKELAKAQKPETRAWAVENLKALIEVNFLTHDHGEHDIHRNPTWFPDEEPTPAPLDTWARGVVPLTETRDEHPLVVPIKISSAVSSVATSAASARSPALGRTPRLSIAAPRRPSVAPGSARSTAPASASTPAAAPAPTAAPAAASTTATKQPTKKPAPPPARPTAMPPASGTPRRGSSASRTNRASSAEGKLDTPSEDRGRRGGSGGVASSAGTERGREREAADEGEVEVEQTVVAVPAVRVNPENLRDHRITPSVSVTETVLSKPRPPSGQRGGGTPTSVRKAQQAALQRVLPKATFDGNKKDLVPPIQKKGVST